MYFANNPESEGGKQLRRQVLIEQMDGNFNLTGDKFICILVNHSAVADIKFGDIIQAKLRFDVDDMNNQLVYAQIKK